MKKIKYIIISALILVFYCYGSRFFSKNGQFIQYYSSYSNSKNESKEKGIYLTDKVDLRILKDSIGIIKNSFDIWLDKIEVSEQYGFLPLRYTYEKKTGKNLEIHFKNEINEELKNDIQLKINGGELVGNYSLLSVFVKPKDTIKVDFYKRNNKQKFGSAEIIIN